MQSETDGSIADELIIMKCQESPSPAGKVIVVEDVESKTPMLTSDRKTLSSEEEDVYGIVPLAERPKNQHPKLTSFLRSSTLSIEEIQGTV